MKKFLVGLLAGVSAGMLFAPKSGKQLRKELVNSKTKATDFATLLLEAGKDASGEVQDLLQSSDIQKMISSGKKSVGEFFLTLEGKRKELSADGQKELENLLEKACNMILGTKGILEKKGNALQKTAQKKATSAVKSVKKVVKKVKKDL